jgi:hypothetical protein
MGKIFQFKDLARPNSPSRGTRLRALWFIISNVNLLDFSVKVVCHKEEKICGGWLWKTTGGPGEERLRWFAYDGKDMHWMGEAQDEAVTKFTVAPIDVDQVEERWDQPVIGIAKDLTLEDTSNLIPRDGFELWKDYVSKKDRDRLSSTRYALVHRFEGTLARRDRDEDSRMYLNHVFVCLRIIRPTRRRFQVIQGYLREGKSEIYSFTNPSLDIMNIPITQALNSIKKKDVAELTRLLPRFMEVSKPGGPLYIQRAVRFYEQGYSSTAEPALQLICWMIGIEAILAKGEVIDRAHLVEKIGRRFGEIDIKEPAWRSYFGKPREPLLVRDQLSNLFTLRDALVHARPIPEALSAPQTDYLGHTHELGAYLSAAAAMILQTAILQEFSELDSRPH